MKARIQIEKKVLSENDRIAAALRTRFESQGLCVLNLVSSPGAGKTSLLERTLNDVGQTLRIGLIAGDVQTENDADRLRRAGGKAVRALVTGGACHLDASMIDRVLVDFCLGGLDFLVIENVGNLVCPSSYDLGERLKVVLISTTEGDDKPLKYPSMFRRSGLMIINKVDLMGTSDFSLERVKSNAHRINPGLPVLELSCRTGVGLDHWYRWLEEQV